MYIRKVVLWLMAAGSLAGSVVVCDLAYDRGRIDGRNDTRDLASAAIAAAEAPVWFVNRSGGHLVVQSEEEAALIRPGGACLLAGASGFEISAATEYDGRVYVEPDTTNWGL